MPYSYCAPTMVPWYKFTIAIGLFFFMLVSSPVLGQTKEVRHGNQQWLQYYTDLVLGDKFLLLTDGGFRWRNGFGDPSQYIIRSALALQPDPNFHLAAGFAFLGFYSDGEVDRTEIRPYQEMQFKNSLGKLKLQHRIRAEQRIFRYADNKASAFNHRFRYRIMLEVPLLSFSNNEKTVSFNIGDEILVNAGKRIVYNIFDHNRLLFGPSLKLNDQLSFSILYNQIYAKANDPNSYSLNQNLWIGVKHSLNGQ